MTPQARDTLGTYLAALAFTLTLAAALALFSLAGCWAAG